MVEIRATTPDWLNGGKGGENGSDIDWTSTPDGRAYGYGKPRALTETSSEREPAEVEDMFPRRIMCNSLRSEPDIDTILPLPGSGAAVQAQMVNVVSQTGSDEVRR